MTDKDKKEAVKLLNALRWRVEKLYSRTSEKSRTGSYNEAIDILSKLYPLFDSNEIDYYMKYQQTW